MYKSPILHDRVQTKDGQHKDSAFYIRQKIELGIMADDFCATWIKVMMLCILVVYMYGAMILKYVSGAESFVFAVSFTIYNDVNAWHEKWPGFDPYYLGLLIFGALSITFCFGNIENSKNLQIFSSIMRIIVVTLMYIGSFYYLGTTGINAAPVFNLGE